jgi:hypothetical protein
VVVVATGPTNRLPEGGFEMLNTIPSNVDRTLQPARGGRRGRMRLLRPSIKRRSGVVLIAAALGFMGWLASGIPAASTAGAAVQPLTIACTTTTPIAYGPSSIAGSIATAGADACFTFTTAPGDVVWLNMARTSGSLSLFYDFYRPGAISTCASPYDGATECPVPSGGSGGWTLQVSGDDGTTGSFRLSIQRLDLGVGCKALQFGKAVTAHLKEAASSDCYTFTTSSGAFLYARSIVTRGSSGLPSLIESAPTGTEQCDAFGTVECPLPASGDQTLLLSSDSTSDTGTFRIYAQQMTGPKHCTALAVGGAAKDGSVAKAGDVACFTFAGTSGDTDVATLTGLKGTLSPEIDFFEPSGTSACASSGTSVTCSIGATGSWTVLVYDSSGSGTGSFAIAVTKK